MFYDKEFLGNKFKEYRKNANLKQEALAEKADLNRSFVGLLERGKTNIKLLSQKEIKTLLSASCKDNWYLEILLALFCGLRKGEIRGLKFSDFNEEKKTVKIQRQLGNQYELKANEFKVDLVSAIIVDRDMVETEKGKRLINLAREKGWKIYIRKLSELGTTFEYNLL